MEEWSVYTFAWFYHSACFQIRLLVETVHCFFLIVSEQYASQYPDPFSWTLGLFLAWGYQHLCASFYIHMFLFLFDRYIGVEALGHRVGICSTLGFPGGSVGKESACSSGDMGQIPGTGRSPGRAHGIPLQYSCLENPMNRGAQQLYSPQGHRFRCD